MTIVVASARRKSRQRRRRYGWTGSWCPCDRSRGSITRTLRIVRGQSRGQAAFPPDTIARALRDKITELLDLLLPARRQCANPRVIKQKMSNWALKHAGHRNPPQPLDPTIAIVAATKPARVKTPAKSS